MCDEKERYDECGDKPCCAQVVAQEFELICCESSQKQIKKSENVKNPNEDNSVAFAIVQGDDGKHCQNCADQIAVRSRVGKCVRDGRVSDGRQEVDHAENSQTMEDDENREHRKKRCCFQMR